jgi:D-aminopeptidase
MNPSRWKSPGGPSVRTGCGPRRLPLLRTAIVLTTAVLALDVAAAQSGVRARDLGIPLEGAPGANNAITDVPGVEVGHVTLIEGSGRRIRGKGPVRTGVTAILPRGRGDLRPSFASWFSLNGNGEMTGTAWIEDSGFLTGPLMLTNTFSVGTVRDAVIEWQMNHAPEYYLGLPVVSETSDRHLNDRAGFHVGPEHAFQALENARSGPVEEGGVGAGTGTICHGFKAGIGTSSRVVSTAAGDYSVGVLVQCNYGARRLLQVAGVPVGQYLTDLLPCHDTNETVTTPTFPRCGSAEGGTEPLSMRGIDDDPGGSIIIVVATDAPLLPHQLSRVARRAGMGLAHAGSVASNASGDLFIAFSTANEDAWAAESTTAVAMLPNGALNPIFEATVQATAEAILNSMIGAETMVGADWIRVEALPRSRLQDVLRQNNRLESLD